MLELHDERRLQLQALFPRFGGNLMLQSFFDGKMGRGWANDRDHPESAIILIGDFCCFGGIPKEGVEQTLQTVVPQPSEQENLLLIPETERWDVALHVSYGDALVPITRYAMSIPERGFSQPQLRAAAAELPKLYTMQKIDAVLFARCAEYPLFRDFCSQYESKEDYLRNGLGYAVLYKGELVGGASSYVYTDKGIEIEIATAPEHRRKGLAKACAAQLILSCLAQEKIPEWDAANLASVKLAETLGYELHEPYQAYGWK